MLRIHLRPIKLRKWFPPNDPLATIVARLCILREDFILELRGMEPESIKALDQHSEGWRRMYFLRASVRSLGEIDGAITTLLRDREFQRLLRENPKATLHKHEDLVTAFRDAHNDVKKIRNWLGGHVLHSRVQETLDSMNSDQWGFLEVGRRLGNSHFKFAGEIVASMLVADVPRKERRAKLETYFDKLSALLPALELIDDIVALYAKARKLI